MTPPSAKPAPLLSVHPVFDPGLAAVESALAAVLGGVLASLLGGTLIFLLFGLLGLGRFVGAGGLYTTFLLLGFALSPAVYYELKKRAWQRTGYHFYPDYFEYQDFKFLLQRRRGRIRLRDVRDVYERASPLQAHRLLTSVYLFIPGFPSQMQYGMPGIKIGDVPEKADLRDRIVDLVEDSHRRWLQGPPPEAAPSPPSPSAPEAGGAG